MAAARFVPLALSPASSDAAHEVHLPGGARVLVHASAGERLSDVLAALEKSSC